MAYVVLLGVALVRRWIEWIGWQALNAIAWMVLLLLLLMYTGWTVFADDHTRKDDGDE